MSVIKSFSVGNGDMFYIKHNSDNFTIIDCCLSKENKKSIVDEILTVSKEKDILRFISTHPDDDHIAGLKYLDERHNIVNFYCVKNEAKKKDESEDFNKYCDLRDSEKAFFIFKGCNRKWMNQKSDERGSSGINILWPDTSNKAFREALDKAKNCESPNNLSPIITYSVNNGARVMWMGDLENEFMINIESNLSLPKIDVLFAPHHGRDSGKVPTTMLEKMEPKIIVIGEAPSENLNYYPGYNTITQLSAGDITFVCDEDKIHVYASNETYVVTFLKKEDALRADKKYLGSFVTHG